MSGKKKITDHGMAPILRRTAKWEPTLLSVENLSTAFFAEERFNREEDKKS